MSKIKVNSIEAATGSTVTLSSGQTLDLSSGTVTLPNSSVNLTTKVTGTLPVANGGTGLTTLGSATQVLRVNSGATALEFATAPSGKVLQVVQTVVTTAFSTSSGSLVDITGLTASITPSSASNKVLIITHVYTGNGENPGYPRFSLFRGETQINLGASAGSATRESMTLGVNAGGGQMATVSSCFLDSPSTTSSTTYKWQTSVYDSRTQYFNVPSSTGDANAHTAGSTITLMEIAG